METTIVTGPRFWTGDPSRAWADGLLVSQGKIVRTVERSEIARLLARGGTVITLPGVLAVPGLVDAHAHLVGYAMGKREAELTGAATLEETLERVRSFAKLHPKDPWVVGRGWDQTDWPDKAWPSADRLEQVVSDRPVALSRVDGHAMWVNRTALSMAGIDAKTPDPPGGKIHRDAQGRPTGILIDAAIGMVESKIPASSDEVVEEALAAAANDLLAVGLTGVHDMGANEQLVNALTHLAKLNRWPLRVTGYAGEGSSLHQRLLKDGPFVTGRISIPGVKLYADGALGSRGARLLAPYSDEPGSQGLWVTEPTALQARVDELIQHGLQPAIHAIGDAANRAVLDAYQQTARKNPHLSSLRPRVEHAQIVDPADFARFAPLVARNARDYGLDPALVKAVIAAESGFDPAAVSDRGAVGLMQVLPDTGERYGVAGDAKRSVADKLKEPAINVRVGARYLRDLIARFEGDVKLALAAYNAGEGVVERYGGIPPYPETQAFVRLVGLLHAAWQPPAPPVHAPSASGRVTIVKPGAAR